MTSIKLRPPFPLEKANGRQLFELNRTELGDIHRQPSPPWWWRQWSSCHMSVNNPADTQPSHVGVRTWHLALWKQTASKWRNPFQRAWRKGRFSRAQTLQNPLLISRWPLTGGSRVLNIDTAGPWRVARAGGGSERISCAGHPKPARWCLLTEIKVHVPGKSYTENYPLKTEHITERLWFYIRLSRDKIAITVLKIRSPQRRVYANRQDDHS
jgi:hypothetical protein